MRLYLHSIFTGRDAGLYVQYCAFSKALYVKEEKILMIAWFYSTAVVIIITMEIMNGKNCFNGLNMWNFVVDTYIYVFALHCRPVMAWWNLVHWCESDLTGLLIRDQHRLGLISGPAAIYMTAQFQVLLYINTTEYCNIFYCWWI